MPLTARNSSNPPPGTPVSVLRQTPGQRVMRSRTLPMKPVEYSEFLEKLVIAEKGNEDYEELSGRDFLFNEDGTAQIRGGPILSWNDFSFQQFAQKLKIPHEFIKKSPNGDGPASKKAIIDYWKEQHDDHHFFVRSKMVDQRDPETGATGFVRAFLGGRYGVFDNVELVEMMGHFVQKDRLVIQAGQITDKALHFRLLYPDQIDAGGVGQDTDLHQVGMHLRNSEVGFTNFMADFMLFRQVCSNGLIAMLDNDHLVDQKHLGVDHHQVRMLAQASFDTIQERHGEVIARVGRLHGMKLKDPVREMIRLLRSFRIGTEEIVSACERAFEAEPGNSRFYIVQAITRAAQGFPLFQRIEMEEVAGRLMMSMS